MTDKTEPLPLSSEEIGELEKAAKQIVDFNPLHGDWDDEMCEHAELIARALPRLLTSLKQERGGKDTSAAAAAPRPSTAEASAALEAPYEACGSDVYDMRDRHRVFLSRDPDGEREARNAAVLMNYAHRAASPPRTRPRRKMERLSGRAPIMSSDLRDLAQLALPVLRAADYHRLADDIETALSVPEQEGASHTEEPGRSEAKPNERTPSETR